MDKKLGDIRVTQRTAVGQDQSAVTKVYVITGLNGPDVVDFIGNKDAHNYKRELPGVELIGFYDVAHPAIMAGDWDEIFSDFCRKAERKMVDDDLLVYNEAGIGFLASAVRTVD